MGWSARRRPRQDRALLLGTLSLGGKVPGKVAALQLFQGRYPIGFGCRSARFRQCPAQGSLYRLGTGEPTSRTGVAGPRTDPALPPRILPIFKLRTPPF